MSRSCARRLLAVVLALAVVTAAGPAPASAATIDVTEDDFESGSPKSGYSKFGATIVNAGVIGNKSAEARDGEYIQESLNKSGFTLTGVLRPDISNKKVFQGMRFTNDGRAIIAWVPGTGVQLEFEKSGSSTRNYKCCMGSFDSSAWYHGKIRHFDGNDTIGAKVWRVGNSEPDWELFVSVSDIRIDRFTFFTNDGSGRLLLDQWSSSASNTNSTVTGRITADGSGIANATIRFTNSSLGVNKTVTTNGTGFYDTTLPNGSYQTTTDAPSFVGTSGSATVNGTTTVDRSLVHKTFASGQVVGPDGDPVPNATVKSTSPIINATTTDSNGRYTLYVPPLTDYRLRASATAYESASLTVDLDTNKTPVNFGLNASGRPYVADPSPRDSFRSDRTVSLQARIDDPNGDRLNFTIFHSRGASGFEPVASGTNVTAGKIVESTVRAAPTDNRWYVRVSDGVTTINSSVFEYQTPGVIAVYNRSDLSPVSSGTATIVGETTSYRATRSWSGGQIDLAGVPNDELLLRVTAGGYLNQSLSLTGPVINTSVLLSPESSSGGDPSETRLQGFELDDRTGNFNPAGSQLLVERYYLGEYRSVGGDDFGAANNATVRLEEGIAYRLSVENDGNVAQLGEIVYRPANFNQPETLIIRDSDTGDDGNESDNRDPIARIGYRPEAPEAPDVLHLNATASSDPDGEVVEYRWSIDAGTTRTRTGARPTLPLKSGGNLSITLTVTDDDGATDTVSETVYVASRGEPPIPRINISPNAPDVKDKKIYLNASTSSDPDGSITGYQWSVVAPNGSEVFAGSRQTSVWSPGATTGNYNVSLKVTDNASLTGSTTVGIYLAKNDSVSNEIPTADATATPTSPNVSETVDFDGSGSTDPDGSIASYEWDFDGDGTTDATGATASHSYPTQGTYDVRLVVTDDDGSEDSDVVTVTVGGGEPTKPPNEPPTARINASPSNPDPGQTVRFNGSESTDPENANLSYTWDFDDDGEVDARGETTRTSFRTEGRRQVSVTVTDNLSTTDTATVEITVGSPSDGRSAGYEWNASLIDKNVSDDRAVIDFKFSSQPDTDVENLTVVVYELGNRSNTIYRERYGAVDSVSLRQPLVGNQTDKTWVVEWTATIDGSEETGRVRLGGGARPVSTPLDPEWLGVLALVGTTAMAALYSGPNATLGAIVLVLGVGALMLIQWILVPPVAWWAAAAIAGLGHVRSQQGAP